MTDETKDVILSITIIAIVFVVLFGCLFFLPEIELAIERHPVIPGIAFMAFLLVVAIICFRKTGIFRIYSNRHPRCNEKECSHPDCSCIFYNIDLGE